jgi:UPF0042 nucleotide-binding protein
MKLIVISGRSGSGKSTALRALEDAGYNCIDNFPAGLLHELVAATLADPLQTGDLAVCIDARNRELARAPDILRALKDLDVACQVIYLDAASPTLVKRFSETRRRHPLTDATTDLGEAIDAEGALLADLADLADLTVDTTALSSHQLVELMRSRVIAAARAPGLALLVRSFGFKYGVPVDADLVFDLRILPNPHWVDALRPLNGLDAPVAEYLDAQNEVGEMFHDIAGFLERWLPRFQSSNRVYMTVAVGCTGGQHRSIYMAERLGRHFEPQIAVVQVRHRELDRTNP